MKAFEPPLFGRFASSLRLFGLNPWITLTPDRGPNPHFLKKRVRGPKTPISPRSGKGSFLSKNPLFPTREHIENGDSWTENSLLEAFVRARGNGGFWTPKLSFPGNGANWRSRCRTAHFLDPKMANFGRFALRFKREIFRATVRK